MLNKKKKWNSWFIKTTTRTTKWKHQLKEHINKLELENKSSISKINDLNETIHVQSNEIINLKLSLSKYEPVLKQNDDPSSKLDSDSDQNDDQSEQAMVNLKSEPTKH